MNKSDLEKSLDSMISHMSDVGNLNGNARFCLSEKIFEDGVREGVLSKVRDHKGGRRYAKYKGFTVVC